VKVMFFARLRELLGDPAIEVGDEECPDTVGELRALLRERLGGELAAELADPTCFVRSTSVS
jgi:molybdopterin converting factor small subunit